MNRDLVCGTITLAVAILFYVGAAAIPESMLADSVGPAGLPESYAIVLALLSLLLIGRSVLNKPATAAATEVARSSPLAGGATPPPPASPRLQLIRAAGMIIIGIVYIAILPWVGYGVGIGLLIGATILYQGGKLDLRSAAVAIGGAVFFWLVFVHVLHIPEPVGFWKMIKL